MQREVQENTSLGLTDDIETLEPINVQEAPAAARTSVAGMPFSAPDTHPVNGSFTPDDEDEDEDDEDDLILGDEDELEGDEEEFDVELEEDVDGDDIDEDDLVIDTDDNIDDDDDEEDDDL